MYFKSIELENYRPYKGPEKIEFAYGQDNITIVQAVNDVGKTSLLNSFTWCLYGQEYYRVKGREEIWNKSAVSDINKGDNVIVSVTINAIDKKKRPVIIKRIAKFKKIAEHKCRKLDENFEIKVGKNGNYGRVPFPETYLSNNLPEDLRSYFLFDGEQLVNFFKNDSRGLKKAVDNLSQLNLIENMITHINTRKTYFNNKRNKIHPDLASRCDEKQKLEETQKGYENEIKNLELNIDAWKKEKNVLEDELRSHGDNPEKIQDLKDKAEELKQEKIKELDYKHQELMLFLLDKSPFILSKNVLTDFINVASDLDDDSIFRSFSKNSLKKLLDSGRCICGTELTKDSDCYSEIERILEEAPENLSFSETVREDVGRAKSILQQYPDDIKSNIRRIRDDIQIINTDIIKLNREIENHDYKLRNSDIDIVKNLKNKINKLEKRIKNAERQIGSIQNESKRIPLQLEKIDKEIIEEKKSLNAKTKLDFDYDFCDKLSKIATKLLNELTHETHNKLQELTDKEFRNIHWKEDYKRVIINPNTFEVSIEKKDGSVVAGTDPSSGSQLVLALSFITSLNSLTGFELPMIIDTPLGRISGEIRETMANYLFDYAEDKQLALFVTDKEYEGDFKRILQKGKGKEYILRYYDGVTEVYEV